MPSILLTGPAIEPWSVEEPKSFLRAENDDDDAVLDIHDFPSRLLRCSGSIDQVSSVLSAKSSSTFICRGVKPCSWE